MRPTATLEEKHHNLRQTEKILADALRGQGGKLTKADAIAKTGLPQQEVEPALEILLKEYKSHLEVTEKGEILYEFDPAMVRRDAVPLRERFAALGRTAWKLFVALFKVWIVATIVVYVAIYVLIMLAMLVASQQGDNRGSRRSSSRGSSNFGNNLFFWWFVNPWRPATYGGQWVDRGRYSRPHKKRFMEAIFDFCFGPPEAPKDPLGDEKRIVGFIRQKAGRLTASDLVALMGWSYDKAEEEVTRLLVDYSGDPEVTDDGTIVYTFKDLRVTAESATADPAQRQAAREALEKSAAPVYFWQQPDPKERLTGNTGGQNALIAGLNLFNLFGAFFLGSVGVRMAEIWARTHGIFVDADFAQRASFWLTTFPLAFTACYFLVPIFRTAGLWRRERQRRTRNLRRAILRAVFERGGAPAAPEQIIDRAAGNDPAIRSPLRGELDRVLVPYEGDVGNDPTSGQVIYRFPRLERESKVATELRAAASLDEARPGEIVYDTDQ